MEEAVDFLEEAIYLYVFYNVMLDIGERATELMFPV